MLLLIKAIFNDDCLLNIFIIQGAFLYRYLFASFICLSNCEQVLYQEKSMQKSRGFFSLVIILNHNSILITSISLAVGAAYFSDESL